MKILKTKIKRFFIFLVTLVFIFPSLTKANYFNIWDTSSNIGPSVLQWQGLAMSNDGTYISGTVLNGPIYVSTNGGTSFTSRASNRAWRGIAMSGDGMYQTAVVFASTTVPGYIYRSTNYGTTWTQVGINKRWINIGMSKDGRYQTAVSYHTTFGGFQGRVVTSSDFGANWNEVTALNNRTFGGIAVSESGQYQIISDASKNVEYSSDYGATWTPTLTTTNNYVQGLAMSADGTYMTAVEDGGNIWVSSNRGANWTEIVNTKNWKDVRMSSDGKYQTASSVNTKYMAISNDYGQTWTQVMSSNNLEWTALAMSKEGNEQVVASYLTGSQSKLFKSSANCVLTYTAGANGSLSGETSQTLSYKADGSSVTAIPDPSYSFVKWSDDSTSNPRTDVGVIASISVTAEFALKTYTLTYTVDSGGSISGTAIQTINHGSSGTAVTAVPNTGYHFDKWSDNSTDNPRTDTNVTSDLNVSAVFSRNRYTIKNVSENITLQVEEDGYSLTDGILHGEKVTIKILDNQRQIVAKTPILFEKDLDWKNLNIGIDFQNGKSFVSGLDETFDFFIPKSKDTDKIRICPGVSSLEQISSTCENGYDLTKDSANVISSIENDKNYWLIKNVTNMGGISFSLESSVATLATTDGQAKKLIKVGANIFSSTAKLILSLFILTVLPFAFYFYIKKNKRRLNAKKD
jgi:hypothetical protein